MTSSVACRVRQSERDLVAPLLWTEVLTVQALLRCRVAESAIDESKMKTIIEALEKKRQLILPERVRAVGGASK